MFKKPTVLVLGAGASCPVGFPTSWQLTETICKECRESEQLYNVLTGIFRDKINDINVLPRMIKEADMPSIDKFLEENERFAAIGKFAIAYKILESEKDETLLNRNPEEDWYAKLYEQLIKDSNELSDNKLNIVTFNYDRSLEEYLYRALCKRKNASELDVVRQMKSLNIVHIYGSLGHLPWQDPNYRKPVYPGLGQMVTYAHDGLSYATAIDPGRPGVIFDASRNIRLIGDRETSPECEQASKLINEAERVHFLGFGFDDTNLKRLKIEWDPSNKEKFSGTSSGLGRNREKEIIDLTNGALRLYVCKIKEYFHDKEYF